MTRPISISPGAWLVTVRSRTAASNGTACFKTGAAVDVQFSTDPDAPADRKAPVKGDKRLLITVMKASPSPCCTTRWCPHAAGQGWEAVSRWRGVVRPGPRAR